MLNSVSERYVTASPRLIEWVRGASIALLALAFVSPAVAEKGKLRERLTPEVMAVVFPGGASRHSAAGSPPPSDYASPGWSVPASLLSAPAINSAPRYSTKSV